MGRRGPVPKRTVERHGHMSEADRDSVLHVEVIGTVTVPPVDESWHPVATDWYRSLAESAQAKRYEPSDWQAARFVAFEMSRMLKADAISPTMFKAVWSAMDSLLTTEGARLRVKVEADRTQARGGLPDGVVSLEDARRQLAG